MTFNESAWLGNPLTHPQEYLSIADVLGTAGYALPNNTTNSITLNLGVGYTGENTVQDAIIFSPPGLLSIPVGPGSFANNNGPFTASLFSEETTQALCYVKNDQWIVLGTRDTRTQTLAGQLNPGETCLFSPISQGRILLKNDSSINLYTAASNTATAMGLFINPATDTISLVNSKGYGIIISDTGITLTMGGSSTDGATIQLNNDGSINIIGTNTVQMDGTGVVLGSIAVTGLNSALIGPTGISGVASTKVLIQ